MMIIKGKAGVAEEIDFEIDRWSRTLQEGKQSKAKTLKVEAAVLALQHLRATFEASWVRVIGDE